MRLWNDFEATADGFNNLIEIISDGKPIHSVSDGSVLSDGRASAGWLFWRPAVVCDTIVDVRCVWLQFPLQPSIGDME